MSRAHCQWLAPDSCRRPGSRERPTLAFPVGTISAHCPSGSLVGAMFAPGCREEGNRGGISV